MNLLRDIKVGDIIGKNSKVLQILGGSGKSGMGIVYICYNSFWKKLTAVKTFQNRFFSSIDVINAFKLEALAWLKLEFYPFIVFAHAVEEIYDQPFLHLEYIAPDKLGRNTLTHYLRSPISLKKALKWGIQFCHAMEHSISHGVTPHRDVKPDNIMITNTQDLKVTDFGLAKLWNLSSFLEAQLSDPHKDRTDEQFNTFGVYKKMNKKNIAGTPPWMAPEHFEGVADSKSDIYSFGVVLFQMANHGKLPFIANSIEGFKEAHQKHPLPRFESSLFPIIKKCMKKSPKNRYHTFNDLRLALEDLYRKETGENINIEIREYDSVDYGAQGSSFLALGLHDEAIQAFNKSLALNNNKQALSGLGLAYLNKGLFDKAIDVLNKAINLSPEYESPYVYLADAYMLKSSTINNSSFKKKLIYSKIKNTFDKLLELNPNNVEGLGNLAMYYSKGENDQKKAVELLKRCIELNPDNPNTYTLLGTCYEKMGVIDQAFVTYKKSVQMNPMYEFGLYKLGSLFLTQKMDEEAFSIFHELTRINPVHELGLLKLGFLFQTHYMYEEALIIFQRLIRISPADPKYQDVIKTIQNMLSNNKEKKKKKKGRDQKNKR